MVDSIFDKLWHGVGVWQESFTSYQYREAALRKAIRGATLGVIADLGRPTLQLQASGLGGPVYTNITCIQPGSVCKWQLNINLPDVLVSVCI